MSDDLKHIKDLVPDPHNRRSHTPRNVGMIVDALHKVGSGRSIVIDENNEILAGNATIEAAGEAGITQLKVIDADGDEIVAVRRRGLTADQKRDLAIYDNRTSELAEWNADNLMKDIESGVDLSSFFNADEVDNLLARVGDPDYDLLDGEGLDKQLAEFTRGVKKAIMIEFNVDEYEEALEIVAWWRKHNENIGRVLIDLLKAQRAKEEE
jgi:hypothetical protein